MGPAVVAGLVALGLASLALRRLGIGEWSYWLDEAMQVSYVRGSFREMVERVRFDGVHPPLDYVVTFLAYHLGGGSEAILRLVPAIWSSLAVVVLYFAAGGRKSWLRGLGAAVFFAATPISVILGQEVRPYALALLLIAVAYGLATDERTLDSIPRQVALVLASGLACFTLYFSAVPLFVLFGSLAWRPGLRGPLSRLARVLAIALPAVAVLAGWLWVVRGSLVHPGEQSPQSVSATKVVSFVVGLLAGRQEGLEHWPGMVVPALLVIIGILLTARREPVHLLTALAGTAAVAAILVASEHWWNVRYFALTFVPLSVLAGAAVEGIASRTRTWAAGSVLLLMVAGHVPAYREFARFARPDWRQVASFLSYHDRGREDDPVWSFDAWSYLTLRVQPGMAARVEAGGIVDSPGKWGEISAARRNGWVVRTPHHSSAWNVEPVLSGVPPWGRFSDAEGVLVFRVVDGRLTSP